MQLPASCVLFVVSPNIYHKINQMSKNFYGFLEFLFLPILPR